MITVLLVIHILVALALIVTVLLQRSEGGGLGIGSSSGGMGGFMTARGTANLLTRTTGILAAIFMGMSLLLAVLAGSPSKDRQRSIFDSAPSQTAPAVPAEPAAPAAPLAR
jgi:preprotein translocase subunit SecG